MLAFIERRDHHLMRKVHRWRAPYWVRLWMIQATRGGDGWLWLLSFAFLLLLGGEERFLAVGEAACAAAFGILLFSVMKRWAGRTRPCHLEPHCWSTLLPPDQFSFPSGHTITAFSVITPLGLHYPDLWPILLFFALSVAASRVVLGMHFLSDVVAGAAIGVALGEACHTYWA